MVFVGQFLRDERAPGALCGVRASFQAPEGSVRVHGRHGNTHVDSVQGPSTPIWRHVASTWECLTRSRIGQLVSHQ